MMPTLFIPHGGGPCFFMDWDPPNEWERMRDFLAELINNLPERPKKLLVVSAHWEEEQATVTSAKMPELIYDYYNFPPHTYELDWSAPGDPPLALKVQQLLSEAGIENCADAQRGFDHGVFIPLKVALPDANIPIVALSLRHDLDPAFHLRMGKALAPLRREGILILGSGNSYHNLRAIKSGRESPDSESFDDWLTQAVEGDPRNRHELFRNWRKAPHALDAHPREEHLMPIFVTSGTAEDESGRRIFTDQVLGARVSAYQFG